MDESRIPWWLIVLLAIATASLAIWQSPRWKSKVRQRAGGLALVYLALLCYAIGGDPRRASNLSTAHPTWQSVDVVLILVGGVCIAAAVFLLGRPAVRGQWTWFTILSLGNASICFMTGNTAVACALLAVGLISVMVLIKSCRRGAVFRSWELLPATATGPEDEPQFAPWLTGGTGFVLALVLIGTCHYAARAETTRATASQRHSALPTHSRMRSIVVNRQDEQRSVGLSELALGRRADIVVLLAVLTFVLLASTMSENESQ